MASNGCSCGLDVLARVVNSARAIKQGKNLQTAWQTANVLSFTGCCEEHDLFYDQGTPWKGWREFLWWIKSRIQDIPTRWFADRLLRECVAENLKRRNRPLFVQIHVPWCIWIGARLGGWISWGWSGNLW